ncbi:MAG: pyridoxal phosphate-dependent aminotransferase [Salinirussus sp.]
MDLTDRVNSIEHSATLQVKESIFRLREEGVDVINMAPGAPDFDTPEHIREAGKRALDEGKTSTTEAKGIPELREAIARKLREENDVEADPDRIITTPGSKFSLFAAIQATIEEGDEAVVLDPSWVSYRQMVRLAGGEIQPVKLSATDGFHLDEDALADAVDDDTSVLVLNNPCNPTGVVFSRDELGVIRDLAVDHDVTVISDEIYETLRYGPDFHAMASLSGMADRTITVNGFSKAYAMTGWRLGYCAAPANLIDAVEKIQSHAVSCPVSFVQHGGVAALTGPTEPTEAMRATYEDRLEAMVTSLREAGVEVNAPEGAFYTFPRITDGDDVALCEEMLQEEGVAFAPGTAFGQPGHVRISATTSADRIRRGISAVEDYLAAAPPVS